MDTPDSGDSFWSEQKGAQWRSEAVCTRQWRYIMVGAGRGRRSEHQREVKQCKSDSGDMLSLDQEGIGGRTTVEKCTWIHQTVEIHFGQSRKGHSGEVKQCAPDSGDMSWSDQEDVGGQTTVDKCTWMHQRVEMHCG
jgi:hypothetical protein